MYFVVNGGKTCPLCLEDPQTGLTKTEVAGVMNEMITDNAILYNDNEAIEIKDAYIYKTNTVELA